MLEATASNNTGVELEKSGQYEAALARYRAASDLDPFNAGFRRNLALCLCRLGRWKEGIAELREVLRLNPDDADATRALYLALDQPGAR
jgi:tetratricopeptide (TPR) repeat protein